MNKQEIIDKIVQDILAAEDNESYEITEELIFDLVGLYGYDIEITDDGNWIITKPSPTIRILFDSSRGLGIPYDQTDKYGYQKSNHLKDITDVLDNIQKFMKEN